jgi:hypothetical protein
MKWKTALIIFGVVIAALAVYSFVVQPLLLKAAAR